MPPVPNSAGGSAEPVRTPASMRPETCARLPVTVRSSNEAATGPVNTRLPSSASKMGPRLASVPAAAIRLGPPRSMLAPLASSVPAMMAPPV